MGFGKLVAAIGAGAVAVIVAPVILPSAIVTASCAVGGLAVTAGASATTVAAVTTGTAYATVGGMGLVAAKAGSSLVEKDTENARQEGHAKGVEDGKKGREAEIEALKNKNASQEKTIKNNEKIIKDQEEIMKIQDEYIESVHN